MYTEFAYAYDRLMNDVPYEAWARYYAGLLELYSIRPGARCVECACGTGSLTIPLAKLGFSMTGMDLSAEMLNLAQQKAREQGMLIPFVRQDMRRLAVQRPVDAVLATCDGPNYLTGSDDLLSFFKQAHAALKPGAISTSLPKQKAACTGGSARISASAHTAIKSSLSCSPALDSRTSGFSATARWQNPPPTVCAGISQRKRSKQFYGTCFQR